MWYDPYDQIIEADGEEDEFDFDNLSEEEKETYLWNHDMDESYYEEIYGLTYEDMFG